MVNSADFAKRLEKILEFYGISATAFSEKIDFNRSTFSHLISGRNKPSLEFVMKVVQTFPEVELYWLLNGKGSFPAQQNILDKRETQSSINVKKADSTEPVKENTREIESQLPSHLKNKNLQIEKIIIFYKDGTFNVYEN